MSEIRCNPITGQWVILAANRGLRPQPIAVQHIPQDAADCPFCEGRESVTPGEVMALRPPSAPANGPGWRVRVVPNKFPALDAGVSDRSAIDQPGVLADSAGQAASIPGRGIHEVIIEAPSHLSSVTQLDDAQFADVLAVYRQRWIALRLNGNFRDAVLFKNSGLAAGATLTHVHSQLIATKVQPPMFADRSESFRKHWEQREECSGCEMLGQALNHGNLTIADSQNFVAFCPFASRFAYEVWIMPRRHCSNFDELAPEILPELAGLFRGVLVKLERILKVPAYNYILHTAPFDTTASDHYHWHIEILPRIANLAGFELGTGCFINTVLPDSAAKALRKA
jgi:UDPglucose--hexose-1-phosphate uridylyltransferase